MKPGYIKWWWSWAVAFLFLGVGQRLAGEDLTSVAIYPLKTTGVEAPLGSSLTSILAAELSKSPRLKIIQASLVQTVMERQAINLSDMYDSSKNQVELGRMVAAQKILLGEVLLLGGKYQLNLNLIDVEKGTTDLAQSEICPCSEEQLSQLATEMATKIRQHFGENPPPSSPPGPAVSTDPVEALAPAVMIADKSLKKKVLIEASKASRTATGTVGVVVVVQNHDKADLKLQARTQFLDKDHIPAVAASAWKRLFVRAGSRVTYNEVSMRMDIKYFQVEIREER
jgi:hypothetical protein